LNKQDYYPERLFNMIKLDLDKNEVNVLIEALESNISELRMEIADTDSSSFREKLKEKKRILNRVLHIVEGKDENTAD
jgi:hypothetical protein